MAVIHGRNAQIYFNGVNISGDLNTITPHNEQELNDITTFGQVGHTFYPGLYKTTGTIEAIYNSTSADVFKALLQTEPGYAMMIAMTPSVGTAAYATNECMLIENNIKSVVTDVNRVSFNFDVDNYPFEQSAMLTAGIYTVAASSTGDYASSVNNGSASATTGGAAYLQIMSITSTAGTLTVHIEQSATGAFAGEETTTCTFAAASTTGTQRIALTSQIAAYGRVSWANAGAATCSFACALARYNK